MKIQQKEINYIEYLCDMIPRILKNINKEFEEGENYVYSSSNRAKFDRLRIEMNKTLIKIKKEIYNENN